MGRTHRCSAAAGGGAPLGILLVILVAVGISGRPARAQEDPRDRPYPHGDWSEDCSLCHRDEQWLPVHPGKEFKHSRNFPLEGAHRAAACRACHATLEFDKPPASTQCVHCHQDAHRGEFGLDCARCHNPRSFIDRTTMVRNHRAYRFPLSGAHVTVDCDACHITQPLDALSYVGLATDCASCHFNTGFPDAEQRPPSPPHPDQTDCDTCHSTVTFDFNHRRTRFPLTGAHLALQCSDCHADGVFRGRSTACYSCHQSMYEATSDPSHVVANFDHNCARCHNTTTFSGARYLEHDSRFFPIYSGQHLGRWDACSDCHVNSGTYSEFSCLLCHVEPQTSDNHQGVGNYRYDSLACYQCHPRGERQ
jgi:hypothetical protein